MKTINNAICKFENLILDAEKYIWNNPETGYKEFKTNAFLLEKFRELGYEPVLADGITGFYCVFDTGRPGPTVLILSELDAVICHMHPDSDNETGAVHACGHNAQCAALLGIAAALKEPEFTDGLCGKIQLCAVPAEELLEIEYRGELIRQGKIKYMGGKTEFLHRGYFDDADIAFMVHTSDKFEVMQGAVGCMTKKIIYKGKSAHAGGAPWDGQNALYAANCGLNAINAIRETFKDSELVRVHPIITHGGDVVNTVPDTVTLESFVRASNLKALEQQSRKVNRALCGAALSLGTNIEIIDAPGYAPLHNDTGMIQICKEAALELMPEEEFTVNPEIWSASTDMGDLSSIMPVVHPFAAGGNGTLHGSDYEIADKNSACIVSAKWQLLMLKLLLENNALRAKQILADFEPEFASKEEFLAYQDSINDSGNRITYNSDGSVTVR